jgi:hypothetical protein
MAERTAISMVQIETAHENVRLIYFERHSWRIASAVFFPAKKSFRHGTPQTCSLTFATQLLDCTRRFPAPPCAPPPGSAK